MEYLIGLFTGVNTALLIILIFKQMDVSDRIDVLQTYIDELNEKIDKFQAEVGKLDDELGQLSAFVGVQEENKVQTEANEENKSST